jgi:MarR family transcriptional regulator, organic hydroperoxide resistance regulator
MPTFIEYTKRSFGHKVYKSARLINHRLGRNFKESNFEITTEQWKILLYLWREDGQTQNSLAISTGKDEPSVSRIINTMVKHNLVIRCHHPKDRRTNLIYLTETGKNIKEDLMALGGKTNSEATQGIELEELAICIRVLDKVIENLS